MPTQKRTQEVFEVLSKGQFISSNSPDDRIRKLFHAVEDNYDELYDYFSEINFTLERGDEYFYFSRAESRNDLERKIERAYQWIDILDFLKAYDNSFGPGYRFSPADILVKLNVDVLLKSKLTGLKRYIREENFVAGIQKLIDLLCRAGFVELENEVTGSYKVLSSFSYLENLVLSIHMPEDIQNEIPE